MPNYKDFDLDIQKDKKIDKNIAREDDYITHHSVCVRMCKPDTFLFRFEK